MDNGEAIRMLHERLGDILNRHVAPLFKDGVKLTLIARTPSNNEADVLITNDTLDGISAILGRTKKRG